MRDWSGKKLGLTMLASSARSHLVGVIAPITQQLYLWFVIAIMFIAITFFFKVHFSNFLSLEFKYTDTIVTVMNQLLKSEGIQSVQL